MMTHTQEEIKEALRQHQLYRAYQQWLVADTETRGEEPPKGVRFALKNLYGANLTKADLQEADLTKANLTQAGLWEANLTQAVLTEANLTGADLSVADLTEANLMEANLRRAIGNGMQVKSMQEDKYHITWTDTDLAIGCQQHPLADWLKFSDEEKAGFAPDALEYLNKWLPVLDSMGVFDSVKNKETE